MGGKKIVKYRHFMFFMMASFILPSVLLKSVLMLMFIPSDSMYPSLKAGELLIGTRNTTAIARGDILAFKGPDSKNLIKRVIGMPGDHVHLANNGDVYINGEKLDEPYILNQRSGRGQEFNVPLGHYLFLGDNRVNSMDARYWECPYISSEKILAKASFKINPAIFGFVAVLIITIKIKKARDP